MSSKWCPGLVCLSLCLNLTKQESFVISKSPTSIRCNVWHHCAVTNRKSIHNFDDKSNNVKLFILFMYPKPICSSQTELYFGKLGFKLNIPCINFFIKKSSLKPTPPQSFTKLLTADLAVWNALYCNPFWCKEPKNAKISFTVDLIGFLSCPQ